MSHRRQTGSFTAKDEAGREYTITEFTHFTTSQPLAGPSQEYPTGQKEFVIDDGRNASPIDDSRFQVVANTLRPLILTRN